MSEPVATIPVRPVPENLGNLIHDRLLAVVGVEGEDVEGVHVVHGEGDLILVGSLHLSHLHYRSVFVCLYYLKFHFKYTVEHQQTEQKYKVVFAMKWFMIIVY